MLPLSKFLAVYEETQDYIIAAVLDSRFKLRWCKDENERTSVKSILTNRLADVNHVPSAVNQHVVSSDSEPPKKKRLFSFMEDKESHSNLSTNYEIELNKYLEEPCVEEKVNPLTYWKECQLSFPCLAELSKMVLGIPASCGAIV